MRTEPRQANTQKTSNEGVKPSNDTNVRVQIEKRAYEIWMSSGGSNGSDVVHWLQAEAEVLARNQKNQSQPH